MADYSSQEIDKRNTHTVKVNDVAFEVDVRYIDLAAVGGGSYGRAASTNSSRVHLLLNGRIGLFSHRFHDRGESSD
jgi:hypothetical protein